MKDAVNEIKYWMFVDEDVTIDIVVDSDVDGYTSAAIVYKYLSMLNSEWRLNLLIHNEKVRGLEDKEVMDKILEHKPSLVIIPDAGSNNVVEANVLKDLGISLLILDHHDIVTAVEYGILVNNQTAEDKVDRDGSGCLVTWQFLKALDNEWNLNWSEFVIDLVAFSLVGDACNMTSQQNRCIYHYGLETLNCVHNEFLGNLILRFIGEGEYSQRDIGWKIVPKINSVIRSDDASLKQRVILAFLGYEENMPELLDLCEAAHSKQIRTVDGLVKKIVKNNEEALNNNIVVIEAKEMPRTYSGLVAGKLVNMVHRPVLLGKSKDGVFLGSLRSPIDIREELNNNELTNWCSGHGCAAGFQMPQANIDRLIEYYNAVEMDFTVPHSVLRSYPIHSIPEYLFSEFEPYTELYGSGLDNPQFHIVIDDVTPSDFHILGKNGLTLKLTVYGIDVLFFTQSKEKKVALGLGCIDPKTNKFVLEPKDRHFKLELIGSLSMNEYGDTITPTIIVNDYETTAIVAKKKITAENIFKK